LTLSRALETGDLAELPSRRDEDWRWSDLRGLIRAIPPTSPDESARGEGPFDAVCSESVLVINGGSARIHLAAGEKKAIALRLISRAEGTSHSADVAVSLEDGAQLTLLESHESFGAAYITDVEMDIVLGAGAVLERVVITSEAADAIAVTLARVGMGENARFCQTTLTLGAKRERNETQLRHPGAGASVRLDGVYLAGNKRHADLTTAVTHTGAGGTTDQLTKGAVAGQGRGVFQGRITVERGADKTDAKMGHHALILDDRGEVDSKPELLIFADDVACAHGNTVGQLDEQAIFYARQRGMPLADARALLTQAFIGEVIDRIEHEGAREVARTWAGETLRELA
jgi:Fe-S cluster assembly protein SufD